MNRRVLILVAVMLIVGAVVIPPLIPNRPKTTVITVTKVTQDMEPGTIITADMVEVDELEVTGDVPVVQASGQVVGTIAKKLIKKGDTITQDATVPLSPWSVALYLEKEVISFYADIDEALGGILKQGNKIDIYAYHLVQEDEPTRLEKIAACILVVDSHGSSGNPTKWATSEAEEDGGILGMGGAGESERVVPASIITVAVEPEIAWRLIEFLGSRGFRAWVTLSDGSCWMPPTPTPTPTPIPPTPTPTPTPTPVPPTPTPTPTPGPRPDVRLVSITSDPSLMIEDQPGTVLVEVENQGSADMTTKCLVGLYIDRPARGEADKLMVCPLLGVGESALISYTVTLDEAGYHLLTAWADVLEAIPEEDETNNQDSASILVVEPPPPTPTPTNTPTVIPATSPTPETPSHIHVEFRVWLLETIKVVDLEGRPVNMELKKISEGIYYADYYGRGFEMTVKNNRQDMHIWIEDEKVEADVFIDGDKLDAWEKIPIGHGQERTIKVQLCDGFNEAMVVLVDD
jgi:hypothetical protein